MKQVTIGQWFLLALICCASNALAVIETYEFSDPVLEQRYQDLSRELRCPKCQNQSIADSNSPISRDLRALLHNQLEEGASDDEILGFMVARYGDFVRYRPAVNENTVVLWYGPGVLAVLGLIALGVHLNGKRQTPRPSVSSEELEALRAKLNTATTTSEMDSEKP